MSSVGSVGPDTVQTAVSQVTRAAFVSEQYLSRVKSVSDDTLCSFFKNFAYILSKEGRSVPIIILLSL